MDRTKVMTLRAKKLAILLMDARLAAGKYKKECAELLDISTSTYSRYERGESSPSLPELELLAYFFDVPLEHFWGNTSRYETVDISSKPMKSDRLLSIRQRIVGVLLRQYRKNQGMSLSELSDKTGITTHMLSTYENGENPVPLPELEILANVLGYSMQELFDTKGPVGAWMQEQRAMQEFLELPPDLQAFVGKPINRPYLELAQRLSEMSVEKLRAVAEGLLEITL